ncbi:MAG: Acyl-CoA synthetase forming [Modestobacter sp.]|nr:Acyl-CoA synthetase forming [Modestobacter sp.]
MTSGPAAPAIVEPTPAATSGVRAPAPVVLSRVLLTDGTPAVVRRLVPGDQDELLALHERLSERDRYLRFSTVHPAHLARWVALSLDPAGPALSLGARVRGALVAAVELFPTSADTAEVAAVVDSHWRAHGLATVLLEELAVAAGRLGIHRLVAEVLAENGAMMRVLENLGLPVSSTRDGDAVHLEIALHADDRYAAAAEARHRRAAATSLRPVLVPETVAVVGAGRRAGSIGRAVLHRLHVAGFSGAVLAVNPHATRVDGVPCWPSVTALPCTIDLAVICVPASVVADALEDSGRHGVKAAVVISGGLAAVPGLPDRVRAIADRYGMRLVGPNCVGVFGARAALDATFAPRAVRAGTIGLVAQSGGIVLASLESWGRLGLGFSGVVSTGDAYDIGTRDALAWFDENPTTELVVLYAESEPDLRGLARTAAQLSRLRGGRRALGPGPDQPRGSSGTAERTTAAAGLPGRGAHERGWRWRADGRCLHGGGPAGGAAARGAAGGAPVGPAAAGEHGQSGGHRSCGRRGTVRWS